MKSKPKRAISIRQPYAEQILRGLKIREYRSVPTNIRERVYIYASQRLEKFSEYDLGVDLEELPRGVIVGSVEIVGCDWIPKEDSYGYLLANPHRLRTTLRPVKHPQPIWFYPF